MPCPMICAVIWLCKLMEHCHRTRELLPSVPSAAFLLFTAGLGVCSSAPARRFCPLGPFPFPSSPPRPNTTSRYSPNSHRCTVVCHSTRDRCLWDTLGGRKDVPVTSSPGSPLKRSVCIASWWKPRCKAIGKAIPPR